MGTGVPGYPVTCGALKPMVPGVRLGWALGTQSVVSSRGLGTWVPCYLWSAETHGSWCEAWMGLGYPECCEFQRVGYSGTLLPVEH